MSRKSGGGTRHAASTHASPPAYVAVLGAALLSYINALGGDFVHDDLPAVTRNRDVIGATTLSQLLRDDFWGTPMGDAASHKSYRPLTTLSFRLTYLLVGAAPGWFHATNVALHAAASLLFTKLCIAVAGFLPAFATLAGLLFAAHPVHTEAVTGVVGRADVLACVLLLLSLLAYHGQEKPKLWTSVFLAALAMLAKETGVAALLLNLLLDVCRSWRVLARSVQEARCAPEVRMFSRRAASLLVALSALLILRLALLQGSLPRFSSQDNPAAFHPCRYVRFLTFCYLAAFNCWLLLCPTTLSHDWQMGSVPLVTHPTDPRNIATAAFFCCGLILLYRGLGELEASTSRILERRLNYHAEYVWPSMQQQKSPAVLLGLLLLSLPFLPASNLLLTVGFVLAERVLYMPSLGAVLLVSYGAQLLWTGLGNRARSCVLLSAILLIAAFGGRTLLRNRDWISRETLTRAGLKALPHNAKMHYNLANFLRETGRLEQAMSHYTEALRLWPDYASAHNNLGTLLEGAEAESHFIAAIGLAPAHVHAHYNLGQLYRKENRTHESVRVLERCVRLEPGYTPAHLLLARLYAQLGLEERAGKLLRHVVHAHPRCPDRLAHYAAWLHKQGRACEALLYYTKALTEKSSHAEALLGAARVLRSQGQLMRLHRLMLRNLGTSRLSGLLYSGDIYVRTWKLGSEYQSALSDTKTTSVCTEKCSSCPVTSSRRHWRRFVVNRTLVLRPAKSNSNHRLAHQSYPLNYVPQERLPADALLSCETTSAPKDFSTELTTG